jgi:hypothetical protein
MSGRSARSGYQSVSGIGNATEEGRCEYHGAGDERTVLGLEIYDVANLDGLAVHGLMRRGRDELVWENFYQKRPTRLGTGTTDLVS